MKQRAAIIFLGFYTRLKRCLITRVFSQLKGLAVRNVVKKKKEKKKSKMLALRTDPFSDT